MNNPRAGRKPLLLSTLAVFVFIESGFLAVIAVYFLVELIITKPDSYATAVALVILAALAAVWLSVVAVNTLRARPWIRGAVVTWQVLQIAIGISSFQGMFARPDIGWWLIVPSCVVLVVLFTPSVVAATRRV